MTRPNTDTVMIYRNNLNDLLGGRGEGGGTSMYFIWELRRVHNGSWALVEEGECL